MTTPRSAWVQAAPFVRRYGWALAGLVTTTAATVVALSWAEAPGVLTWVATIGPPMTALLLAVAAVGPGVQILRVGRVFALGATLIPILAIATYAAVGSLVFVLVEPLSTFATDLLDDLRVDPTLLEVMANPWALVMLIQLAVMAPLVEETLKPLAAGIGRPASRAHAFVLGAAAGAGFAAIENVLYASGWFWGNLWLPVAVLRSSGAALHLLGAGLISVAIYERRAGLRPRTSVVHMWGIGLAIHAFWNGSVAVAIVLFHGRGALGLQGTGTGWGTGLQVLLGAFGMLLMGAIVVAGRWARAETPQALGRVIDPARPAVVAAWAGLACLMIVPTVVLILAFPDFLSLGG